MPSLRRIWFPIAAAILVLPGGIAAQAIDLSGTVSSKATGRPLSGAVVALAEAGLADTTGPDGKYRLARVPDALRRRGYSAPVEFFVQGGKLTLRAAQAAEIRIELVDMAGKHVAPPFAGRLPAGETAWPLPGFAQPRLLVLRLSAGGGSMAFKILAMPGSAAMAGRPGKAGALAKPGSVPPRAETLRVQRPGYRPREQPVLSSTGVLDMALDPEGIGCAAATLCWDFESGQLPAGTRAAQLPGQPPRGPLPIVDQLQAHTGRYALHLNRLIGQPMRAIAATLPAGFGPVLWGRAYVYITPGAPMPVAGRESSHGAWFKGIYAPDRFWYETGFEKGAYLQIQHIPEPPGFPEWILYTGRMPAPAAWECVEWEFDGRAPSEPRLFVDGFEIPVTARMGWDNGFFAEKPPDLYKPAVDFQEIWLGLDMYHPIRDTTELWFDDVAVARERIGCH